jgi:hypothetical protein
MRQPITVNDAIAVMFPTLSQHQSMQFARALSEMIDEVLEGM